MSNIFETFKSLYRRGKVTKTGLHKAVVDELLTPDQYKEITGEDYVI